MDFLPSPEVMKAFEDLDKAPDVHEKVIEITPDLKKILQARLTQDIPESIKSQLAAQLESFDLTKPQIKALLKTAPTAQPIVIEEPEVKAQVPQLGYQSPEQARAALRGRLLRGVLPKGVPQTKLMSPSVKDLLARIQELKAPKKKLPRKKTAAEKLQEEIRKKAAEIIGKKKGPKAQKGIKEPIIEEFDIPEEKKQLPTPTAPADPKTPEPADPKAIITKKILIRLAPKGKPGNLIKPDRTMWYHDKDRNILGHEGMFNRVVNFLAIFNPKKELYKLIPVYNKKRDGSLSEYAQILETLLQPLLKKYLNENPDKFEIEGDLSLLRGDKRIYINHDIYNKITGLTLGGINPETEKKSLAKRQDQQKKSKRMKANLYIDELNHVYKKDVNKKRKMIGRYLYYLVKNGFFSLAQAENFLKERGRLQNIDTFPWFRSLYEIKMVKHGDVPSP